jgi:hypothetical protein
MPKDPGQRDLLPIMAKIGNPQTCPIPLVLVIVVIVVVSCCCCGLVPATKCGGGDMEMFETGATETLEPKH